MIVNKYWVTYEHRLQHGYTTMFEDVERKWVGWFLFGIIPLYVKQIDQIIK